jgi:hypothetical protein
MATAGASNEARLADPATLEALRRSFIQLETGASTEPAFIHFLTASLGLQLTTEAARLLPQSPTFTALTRALKRGNEALDDAARCFGAPPPRTTAAAVAQAAGERNSPPRGAEAAPAAAAGAAAAAAAEAALPRHLQEGGAGAIMFPVHTHVERARSPLPLQPRTAVLEAARGVLARVEGGTLAAHAAPAALAALGLPVAAIPALARGLQAAATGRAEYSRTLAACDAHLAAEAAAAAEAASPQQQQLQQQQQQQRAHSPQQQRSPAQQQQQQQWHAQLRGGTPPHAPAAAAAVLGGSGNVITWQGVPLSASEDTRAVRSASAAQALLLRHPTDGVAAAGYGPGVAQAALLESPSKASARGFAGALHGVRSPPPF